MCFFWFSLDCFVLVLLAFAALRLGLERLRNDLFCVEWDVKILTQSSRIVHCANVLNVWQTRTSACQTRVDLRRALTVLSCTCVNVRPTGPASSANDVTNVITLLHTRRHRFFCISFSDDEFKNPVYTIRPVVKPVEQPVEQPAASCKQTFNRGCPTGCSIGLTTGLIVWTSPSVLWRCWLGDKNGVRPLKLSGGVLASVWSEVQMICIWPSWCFCSPIICCFIEIQIGLTFGAGLPRLSWKTGR